MFQSLRQFALKMLRDSGPIAAATVRPAEVATSGYAAQQATMQGLVDRYRKWVKVAVSRNAGAVASNPLRLYTRKGTAYESRSASGMKGLGQIARKSIERIGDEYDEIIDPANPLLALLRTANPRDNGHDLLEYTETAGSLTGNAYWAVVRGPGGIPVELWPLAPQFVRVIPDRERWVSGYWYGRGRENERRFDAEDIIHFRRPNPLGDPYYGMGDLEACIGDADLSLLFTDAAIAMLEKGMNPGGILSGKGLMNRETREVVEAAMSRKHSGVGNFGKLLCIGADVEYKPFAAGEKEVAFLKSADTVKEVISAAFDVPRYLLSPPESASLATAKAAMNEWQMAVRMRCLRIEDQMNQMLVPTFGSQAASWVLCFDDPVTKDTEAANLSANALYGGGVITLNEARNMVDLDPVDDGDEFKAPPPSPFGMGFGDKPEPEEDEEEEDAEPAKIIAFRRLALPAKASVVRPARKVITARSFLWGHPCPCEGHKEMVADGSINDDPLYRAMLQFFRKINPQIMDAVTGTGLSGAYQRIAFGEALEETAGPELLRIFSVGYDDGADEIRPAMMDRNRPSLGAFAVTNTDAMEYLSTYKIKLSRSISDTMEDKLRKVIADGIEAGDSTREIQGAVKEVLGGTDYQAEMIARTETSRAYQNGSISAWSKSGIVSGKQWVLSGDPCELCIAMSASFGVMGLNEPFLAKGGRVNLPDGGEFVNDYADMTAANAHPNDQCSIEPVLIPVEAEEYAEV